MSAMIAEALDRYHCALQRRLKRLGIDPLPIRLEARRQWEIRRGLRNPDEPAPTPVMPDLNAAGGRVHME